MESLDKGRGECVLRQPELSTIVADSLLHFDSDRYHLGDFVVMPNHMHLIVGLLGHTDIEALCTSWKQVTARRINQALSRSGRFWQAVAAWGIGQPASSDDGTSPAIVGSNDRGLVNGVIYTSIRSSGGFSRN